jgi:hypothetical protein
VSWGSIEVNRQGGRLGVIFALRRNCWHPAGTEATPQGSDRYLLTDHRSPDAARGFLDLLCVAQRPLHVVLGRRRRRLSPLVLLDIELVELPQQVVDVGNVPRVIEKPGAPEELAALHGEAELALYVLDDSELDQGRGGVREGSRV